MTDATPDNEKKTPDGALPVVAAADSASSAEGAAAARDEGPLYDLVEVPPAVASAAPILVPSEVSPQTGEPAGVQSEVPSETRLTAQPLAAPLRAPAENWPPEVTPAYAPVVENPAGQMQMIYVPSPVAPPKKGNRGVGILIAIASTVIFAALYAGTLAIILSLNGAGIRFDFLGSVTFYIPVIFFLVGFIALVAIVNRAAWWAYVLGSLFVAVFVYLGTVATGLLLANVFLEAPDGAARLLALALSNPFVIAAAVLAREVSMWMGAAISARGRRVKAKNAEAKVEFDRETAERHAQYEQARYRAPESAV